MDPEERKRGVVAPSSGNHAQAVALAAKLFGIPATVVMPTTVTSAKRGGAERLGARVVLAGTTTADRMRRAEELMREEGLSMVPPYDHPWIIAGQGTVGLEIADDMPNARVIGVEPTGAAKLSRARAAGKPVKLEHSAGLADGLLAVEIGHLTFAHHQQYLDDVVLVDDEALHRAMRLLLDRMKLVVEPSGAITVAALMEGKFKPRGRTVAVLSGGNIEWDGLRGLLGG
jgi:threonine dehydratase